jgi:hypothetical protein
MLRDPGIGGVLLRNGDREFGELPRTKGSMGGMFCGGISMEISMFVGVACEAFVLVLEVLGVDGVSGYLMSRVEFAIRDG